MGNTTVQHTERVLGLVSGKATKRGVDDTISDSWTRCVTTHGLDPSRRYAPRVEDGSRIGELEDQHDTLINIARLEMDALYEQIAGSGYALILTDAQGVILCRKVDPTLESGFELAGLVQGAHWSESMEGTNGIGTCISEQSAVTVHRDDHFRARHINLSCTGAPIFAPDGGLTAVLDASCVNANYSRTSQMHTKAMVLMSARLIEKCLFLRRYRDYMILRFHSRPEFVNLLHDAALAIAEDGTVAGADRAAEALLAASGQDSIIGARVDTLFDMSEQSLGSILQYTQATLAPLRDRQHGRRFYLNCQPKPGRSKSPGGLRQAGSTRRSLPVADHAETGKITLQTLGAADPVMQRNARCASRLASSDVSILLQGPTGCGKDVFARAVHAASDRAEQPYVAVNCAAIPESLIEAELFGYRAGAFTGARKEGARGRILQADRGTLFLDEIGDMPLELQTRLLRVLEERVVSPLGSEESIPVDIRIISASLRNLRDMIAKGRFREDLYYRLNGITLVIPPLCERRDRAHIISSVLTSESLDHGPVALSAEATDALMHYDWPGNIRELRNVLRTAIAMCEDGVIDLADLPSEITHPHPAAITSRAPAFQNDEEALGTPTDGSPLQTAERAALIETIEAHRFNMSRAAKALGVSRNTLYRKLRQHDIDPEALRKA